MTPDNPLHSLWDQLTNAEWLADVGLPLLVTLGAIAGAFVGLRVQSKNDREAWRANVSAEVGRRFGRAILDAIAEMDNAGALEDYWRQPDWSGWTTILHARNEAVVVIGQERELEDAVKLARSTLYVWRACQRGRVSAQTVSSSISAEEWSLAIDSIVNPWINAIRNYATAFMRWDGHGVVPRANIGTRTHIPLPQSTHRIEHDAWMGYYQKTYVKEAKAISDRWSSRKQEAKGPRAT